MKARIIDRVFIYAIIVSLAWHVFWLFSLKIVAAPSLMRAIKFSKVSFLGPISERRAIDLRLEPRERSFLEKRYLARVENMSYWHPQTQETSAIKYDVPAKTPSPSMEEAVTGPKLEPTSRE